MSATKEFAGRHVVLVVENNVVPFDRRVWREACALRDAGARVSVICPGVEGGASRHEILEDVHIYRYRGRPAGARAVGFVLEYAWAFVATAWLYWRVERLRGPVDVLHVANPPDIFWPLGWAVRVRGTRFVFDEHDLTPATYLARFAKRDGDRGAVYRALEWLQARSYQTADVIIATNESYRKHAATVDAQASGKTFVVRNGPDGAWLRPQGVKPELRHGFNHVAAYIGIIGVQDGVEYVVRAIDVLVHQRRVTDVLTYVIGSGDDLDRLRTLAKSLDVEGYIVFTGRIPDGPALEILATADVCLSPDPPNALNSYSTMNKVMEYMALGKPIVSFELQEARYSAGEAALYVPDVTPEAFADAILALLRDRRRSEVMGAAGRQRVLDELRWEHQQRRLLAAYRFLLTDREAPAPAAAAGAGV